jgi:hypothetical protein
MGQLFHLFDTPNRSVRLRERARRRGNGAPLLERELSGLPVSRAQSSALAREFRVTQFGARLE